MEYEPAWQIVHTVAAPDKAEYVPGAHVEHTVDPCIDDIEPTPHAPHAVEDGVEVYAPG